jgi:alpha-ribazole phosphatase
MDTVIDLIRHGEPEGGRRYRGHSIDDPLSEKGWAQMRNATGDYNDWDRIISSPLLRCREFAEELGGRRDLPVAVESDLREVGFGAWEGRTPDEIATSDPHAFESFYRDPVHCRPAGAEPLEEFVDRVTRAIQAIVRRCAGERILVVSHAGVMRATVASTIGAGPEAMYRIQVRNAGVSRIRYGRYGPRLELHNARVFSSD